MGMGTGYRYVSRGESRTVEERNTGCVAQGVTTGELKGERIIGCLTNRRGVLGTAMGEEYWVAHCRGTGAMGNRGSV